MMSLTRLGIASLALPLLVGCGGSGAAPRTSARPATQTVGRADVGGVVLTNTVSTEAVSLPHAVDAVWRILPSVFDSVGIKVETVDPAKREIGNVGYRIRNRLGKVSLSRYLDCGNTQIGPNADNYDVVLTVLSVVTPNGAAAATLTTSVEAQARPATYNQAYSRCSSKGGIEARIAELVKARLTPK